MIYNFLVNFCDTLSKVGDNQILLSFITTNGQIFAKKWMRCDSDMVSISLESLKLTAANFGLIYHEITLQR